MDDPFFLVRLELSKSLRNRPFLPLVSDGNTLLPTLWTKTIRQCQCSAFPTQRARNLQCAAQWLLIQLLGNYLRRLLLYLSASALVQSQFKRPRSDCIGTAILPERGPINSKAQSAIAWAAFGFAWLSRARFEMPVRAMNDWRILG